MPMATLLFGDAEDPETPKQRGRDLGCRPDWGSVLLVTRRIRSTP
jgi:hypothetical protein